MLLQVNIALWQAKMVLEPISIPTTLEIKVYSVKSNKENL